MFPDHGQDPTTLFKHADKAMYEAKRKGNGPVVFEGDAETVERLMLFS
jgi:GGDEF domain-containing protein